MLKNSRKYWPQNYHFTDKNYIKKIWSIIKEAIGERKFKL